MVKQVQVGVNTNGSKKYIKKDLPSFMQYTKEISVTKNGKTKEYQVLKEERDKLKSRISSEFTCPMNWMEQCLDKIQGSPRTESIPTEEFLTKVQGKANNKQMSKFRAIVEEYDEFLHNNLPLCQTNTDGDDTYKLILEKTNEYVEQLSKLKSNNLATIHRLIETSMGLDSSSRGKQYKEATKYTRRMLKMLWMVNKDKFLSCFVKG